MSASGVLSARDERRPRAWRRATAVGLGIAAALLGAELFVRALPAERLGFQYESGVFSLPPEFREDPHRNAAGFHDLELPLAAEGPPRVLLLGDSYVAALSVPLEQTVGRRLAAELEGDRGTPLRVVATGLPGWGQAEELQALRTLGPLLGPQLVVTLLLPFNDIRDNAPALDVRADLELASHARVRPGWLRLRRADAPGLFCERSVLNQWLAFHLGQRRERSSRGETVPLDYEVYSVPPAGEWVEAWQRTESLLRETAAAARALGARYALAVASTPHGVLGPTAGLLRLRSAYPGLQSRTLDLAAPTARLAAICREEGIPFLDLEAEFAAEQARHRTPLHWPRDGHWNAAGNALAARLLAPFVRRALAGAPKD